MAVSLQALNSASSATVSAVVVASATQPAVRSVSWPTLTEEFLLGGTAASMACLVTNPLEVVKTRLQLQGELQSQGRYAKHYRNFFHATYVIGSQEGLLALQKGLVPGLWYQMVMNGVRLGSYQIFQSWDWHRHSHNGEVSVPRAIGLASISGMMGAFAGSPLYMVKTQLQAKSAASIAVGHQHEHTSMKDAFRAIFARSGVLGLWRGWEAQVLRVSVGSAAQLASFTKCKDFLARRFPWCSQHILVNAFLSSCLSGVLVTLCMSPFDVLTTRIYNQPLDPVTHKGLYYSSIPDATVKILKKEGIFGLYKGSSAVFLRLAPHTVLTLVCWDWLRYLYHYKELHKSAV